MSGASFEEMLELWAASLREVKARMRRSTTRLHRERASGDDVTLDFNAHIRGLEPMSEQVIEAVAASNSLRAAPFDNTKRRLDGRARYVVGHNRLG